MPGSLPPMHVAGRLPRLRDRLAGDGLDALLVSSLTNIRYLTGFTGSAGLLFVRTAGAATLVVDGRYGEQASEQLRAAGVEVAVEVTATEQRRVVRAAAAGAVKVGLEAATVTWADATKYGREWFDETDGVVATEHVVEDLRMVKDDGEVARIEAAAGIADESLAAVRGRLADRPTERDFQLELDNEMRRRGAADVSFSTIVASGPNGAKPHARPSARTIEPGDLVVLDFGALLDGYHSDMTRTISVGDDGPTATQRRMLEVVAEAQAAGVAAVGPGVEAGEVDRVCRDHIAANGWGDAFLHGTGHGVGLVIHEAPWIRRASPDLLRPGHVVTVEPGVYLPEHGGVRIEDTVVVTAGGCRALTCAPKAATLQPDEGGVTSK